MSEAQFHFVEYARRVAALRQQLVEALASSSDADVAALVSEVPTIGGRDADAPLRLAFVGQYNAGKSTVISALTGSSDISVDADVCTDTVTAYEWNGIKLLDTPGIKAGYPDHDAMTYREIDRADLLVFVITNELFDDVIGAHFRELAFERDKAREILLVVNKMGQDSGTPEVKTPDIEKVVRPLGLEDLRTVFIDARSHIEALAEADGEDRRELLELAGFDEFVAQLNKFVAERGLMGRLTTPVFTIRSLAQQGEALLSVEMPEERAAIELLSRKRSLFVASRARLTAMLRGILSSAASDLVGFGDGVAESIEPGSTTEGVAAKHDGAQRQAEARCGELCADAKAAVETELADLARQIDALHNGVLARGLRGQVETALARESRGLGYEAQADVSWEAGRDALPSDWPGRLNTVATIAGKLGNYAAGWTTGPFAQAAKVGSATAARGSQGHRVVYNVGKFFGVKFKPWGAVKVARAIGNAGRVIAALGGVFAVVAQIAEDRQNEEQRLQLRDGRDSVRAAYRESVRAIEASFWASYDEFSADFYGAEIAAVDEEIAGLVGTRNDRSESADRLRRVIADSVDLLGQIQSAS